MPEAAGGRIVPTLGGCKRSSSVGQFLISGGATSLRLRGGAQGGARRHRRRPAAAPRCRCGTPSRIRSCRSGSRTGPRPCRAAEPGIDSPGRAVAAASAGNSAPAHPCSAHGRNGSVRPEWACREGGSREHLRRASNFRPDRAPFVLFLTAPGAGSPQRTGSVSTWSRGRALAGHGPACVEGLTPRASRACRAGARTSPVRRRRAVRRAPSAR